MRLKEKKTDIALVRKVTGAKTGMTLKVKLYPKAVALQFHG